VCFVAAYQGRPWVAHQPHWTQPLVDGVGCAHPSSALHHLDLHGPADHCRYCEQEGAQAEGKGLQEMSPSPTHSGLQVWGEAPVPNALRRHWFGTMSGCVAGGPPGLLMTQGANDREFRGAMSGGDKLIFEQD